MHRRTLKTTHDPPYRPTRTGSALLAAVALITIIAILAVTFLLVCRLDARHAEVAAGLDTPDRLATGIRNRLARCLVADLYLGEHGVPYEAVYHAADGNDAWRRYMDFPSDEDDGHDGILASFEAVDGTWPHLTRIHGAWSSKTNDVAIPPDAKRYIDTDGDGVPDAYRGMPDKVVDFRNRDYDVAVRLIDLSGLVCVNTACGPLPPSAGIDGPTCPAAVRIRGGAGGTYDRIAAAREDGNRGTIMDFYTSCAARLSDPGAGYTPFFIDEEPHLRWLDPQRPYAAGRLYAATADPGGDPLPADIRHYLTTRAAVTPALRVPAGTRRLRLNPNDLPREVDLVRNLLFAAAGRPGNAIEKHISHFLANACAYLDGRRPDKSYALPLPGGGSVYGIVPQPVLSEAWTATRFDRNAGGGYRDTGAVFAVEIFNPRRLDLAPYTLVSGGAELDLPAGTPVWTTVLSAATDDGLAPHAGAVHVLPGLDFSGGSAARLVRNAGGTRIPVDIIAVSTDGYPAPPTGGPASVVRQAVAARDTNPARMRYLVALERETTGEGPAAIHTLGRHNGLAPGDIDCRPGFHIPRRISSSPQLVDLGELMALHAVGPDDSASLPEKLRVYARADSRGRADFLNEGSGTSLCDSGRYPDIPWPLLIGELFDLIEADPGPVPGRRQPVVYGRVNINTAPAAVLARLPWPAALAPAVDLDGDGTPEFRGETKAVNPEELAAAIVAFRRRPTSAHRGDESGDNGNTKKYDALAGFLTPAELVVPLEEYTASLYDRDGPAWPLVRHLLYQRVSNLVCTRSNTFAAYITVQKEFSGDRTREWHYLDVIDRSICTRPGALPRTIFVRLD